MKEDPESSGALRSNLMCHDYAGGQGAILLQSRLCRLQLLGQVLDVLIGPERANLLLEVLDLFVLVSRDVALPVLLDGGGSGGGLSAAAAARVLRLGGKCVGT